jgi:pyrroloquinoline quinone biosynthesis protein E
MKEPCKGCPEKNKDFGGCRCQAYLLTGDMEATDPVCSKSNQRHVISEAVSEAKAATDQPLIFRNVKTSKELG